MEGVPASRGYAGGFSAELMVKDLGLALRAARASGAQAPLAELALQLYQRVADDGCALDFSAVYKVNRCVPDLGAQAYQVRGYYLPCRCALGLLELKAGRACDYAGLLFTSDCHVDCCDKYQTMFLIEFMFVQVVYKGADCQKEPEKARDVTESV